jgi:hypothetical protein
MKLSLLDAIVFFILVFGNVSAYYYLELRFGAWARIYASA